MNADFEAADLVRRRPGNRRALVPDPQVAGLLAPGELVLASRAGVLLDQRAPRREEPDAVPDGVSGDLYITSDRLLHISAVIVEVPLGVILEAIITTDTLWLLLAGGGSCAVRVPDPAVLRVELAAARRGDPAGEPVS